MCVCVCVCVCQPGAIDKFCQDTDKIIETVARDTEAKGMFEEAVCLYDLAKVLSVFSMVWFLIQSRADVC